MIEVNHLFSNALALKERFPKEAEFVERLAHHFADLNAIHPFREGNGRTLQTFLEQLAGEAGYTLDFSKVERGAWNAAAKESFLGSSEPMRMIFEMILGFKEA